MRKPVESTASSEAMSGIAAGESRLSKIKTDFDTATYIM
jgi:hypothetical protein